MKRSGSIEFGNRDPGVVERRNEVAPGQARRAMERRIATEHLVDAVLDVVNIGSVLEEDDSVRLFAIIG